MLVRSLKLICTTLIIVVTVLFISPAYAQEKPRPVASLKIGFSIDSLKIERWQTDLAQFQKRAEELGARVLVESANANDELQYRQAQKLLNSGIGVLVLVAHNTDKAARIVHAAKVKHVPVLCYDRLVRNSDVDFYVGFDSSVVGELQATTLTQLAPKGNYVLIGGSPTDNNAKLVREGQMKVLQPLIDRGDVKILADFWATDWQPLEAYTELAKAIESSNGDITAVVASNDGTAGGAIDALAQYKLAGKVLVSGQDADLAAIIRILDGTQTMTVYKPIKAEAKQGAEAAVSLAKGRHVKTTASVANGAKKVPAILLAPIVVTKDNVMQTVIKDGFQDLDTIKQSLPQEKWPK
jgi:D-xylose transport system substrate-binding protein